MARGSLDGLKSGFRLEEPTEIEVVEVVELFPMDWLEAEVRVEDLDEIVVSEFFKAESLEDFRVVDNVIGVVSVSFLTGPRSETGGELDKRDRGEDERVEVVASVLLREK